MISINSSNCTRCYHCVKVCPSNIFTISSEKSVQIAHEHRCIRCGHCVAACGFNAVVHGDFPKEKVHKIDVEKLPTPEQTLLLIRKRRSNRTFSSKPIPEEFLSQILEAAHRAPTAMNLQLVDFTLITNPEKLNAIVDFTLNTYMPIVKIADFALFKPIFKRCFPKLYKYVTIFRNFERSYREQGKDVGILRGATAVLLIHTSKPSNFGREDSQLAYQNASLMAENLGVSQFYTGFVVRAIRQRSKKLEKILGINGTIHAGMALGMPQFEYPNYIDRKEIKLTRL
ncbi:MAG: nitroreductase family protein [Bacteroidales bacterium]|nr:nitroreductase family protein [Bacteroidales bacterium]